MIRMLVLAVALQLSAGVALALPSSQEKIFAAWVEQNVDVADRSHALQFGLALLGVLDTPLDDRAGLDGARGNVIDALSCLTATGEGGLSVLDQVYARIVDTPAAALHMDFVESMFPEVDVVADAEKCHPVSASR